MLFRLLPVTCLIMCCSPTLAEERRLDANGVTIRFTVEGKGEPVVLVHGFMANADFNWRLPGITSALAKSYRVISIDVRGHGQSGKPHAREAYGLEMVKDVIRILDLLVVEKAHVVGYSMGGFITMKLVAEHPERLISATLGGSGGIRDDYLHTWNDAMADKLDAGESLPHAFQSTLPDDAKVEDAQLALLQPLFENQDTKALSTVLRSWRELSVSYEKLKANKIPTLVVYGSNEDDTTRTYIAELEGRMSNAEFQLIDGVDHLTAVSSPLFRDSILKFIEANSAK